MGNVHTSENEASWLPPVAAAIPVSIFSLAALAIPLAAAESLHLSPHQTGAWLAGLYGIPALLSLALTIAYRQPLLVAWHTGVIVFLASLAGELSYADLRGAVLVGGLVVLGLGLSGLTSQVARLVPAPIIHAIVAATALPFVVSVFDVLGDERLLVGGALLAYLGGRRLFGARIPPILPALVVGLVLGAVTGRLGGLSGGWAPPPITLVRPGFSLPAIVTVVPVVVALVAFHANLTYRIYLQSQGYRPPTRMFDLATGTGSVIGSLLGPAPICMGSAVVALIAGPEAGARRVRHWSVYVSAAAFLAIALGAAVAAEVPAMVPLRFLLAVAGLALLGVFGHALEEATRGPLRTAPVLAFAVAASDLSLLGLGAAFWALVVGTGAALLLEGEAVSRLRMV
jgi:benzoate membrane transport protein